MGEVSVIQIIRLLCPPGKTPDGPDIPRYRWFISAIAFTHSQIPIRSRWGSEEGYATAGEAWAEAGGLLETIS